MREIPPTLYDVAPVLGSYTQREIDEEEQHLLTRQREDEQSTLSHTKLMKKTYLLICETTVYLHYTLIHTYFVRTDLGV